MTATSLVPNKFSYWITPNVKSQDKILVFILLFMSLIRSLGSELYSQQKKPLFKEIENFIKAFLFSFSLRVLMFLMRD